MNYFRSFTASLILLLLLFSSGVSQQNNTDRIAEGERFIQTGEYDSAFTSFARAYKEGMAKDSLLYWMAELYRYRSVYDSSLALNLAITNRSDTTLAEAVFRQRFLIYSSLGWSDKVRMISDSLVIYGTARDRFSSSLDLVLNGGVAQENQHIDTTYFWGDSRDTTGERTVTGNYLDLMSRLKLNWRMRRGRTLSLGLKLTASKPYYTESNSFTVDSSFVNGGISLHIKDLFPTITAGYSGSIKKSFNNELSVRNGIDISHAKVNGTRLLLTYAGYDLEYFLNDSPMRHTLWLGSSFIPSSQWSFSCIGTGYITDQSQISLALPVSILYADSIDEVMPPLYSDETYSTKITPDNFDFLDGMSFPERLLYLTQLNGDITSALADSVLSLSKVVPTTYFSINPKVERKVALPGDFQIRLSGGWRFDYYPEPYEWDVIPVSVLYDDTYYLIFNRSDSTLYGITAIPSVEYSSGTVEMNGTVTEGFRRKSVQRRDNTVQAGVHFQKRWERFGTLSLEGEFFRRWSTLEETAPILIPKWHWEIGLRWRKTFNLTGK